MSSDYGWYSYIDEKDVICELHRNKVDNPWGNYHNEQYHCLVYWEDGMIRMTVDEYHRMEDGKYKCCRPYSTVIGNKLEEFEEMSEEQISSKAYNTWCTGAR